MRSIDPPILRNYVPIRNIATLWKDNVKWRQNKLKLSNHKRQARYTFHKCWIHFLHFTSFIHHLIQDRNEWIKVSRRCTSRLLPKKLLVCLFHSDRGTCTLCSFSIFRIHNLLEWRDQNDMNGWCALMRWRDRMTWWRDEMTWPDDVHQL